jgi:hypothetical protein
MTKKLKQIIITAINESKKNTIGSGIAPIPIHFRMGYDSIDKRKSGIAPSPVHFRMGYDSIDKRKSKHLKSSLKTEETSPVKTEDWLGKNDNAGRSVHKITKELLDDADPISKEHAETLRYYSGPDSAVINKKLIDDHYGKKPDSSGSLPKEYIDKAIKHLDKITSHNIRRQLHVYSGLGFDPSKHVDSQGHLHMPAFTSVTHDKNVAHKFAQTNHKEGRTEAKHILHIHLKSYDRATHISGHAFVPDEHESILPRNTTLKVHPEPTMLSDGTHVWHAQVHRQD